MNAGKEGLLHTQMLVCGLHFTATPLKICSIPVARPILKASIVHIESQHRGATTILRHATSDDIPAILSLEGRALPAAHWSELSYRTVFEPGSPFRIAMVLRADGREREGPLQAFLFARISGSDCELENLVVASRNQRYGLGSKLIHALIAEARGHKVARIFLEVRASNTAARCLYEKCGFAITGRRKSYYVDPPEDAVLYALQL